MLHIGDGKENTGVVSRAKTKIASSDRMTKHSRRFRLRANERDSDTDQRAGKPWRRRESLAGALGKPLVVSIDPQHGDERRTACTVLLIETFQPIHNFSNR
jgi:hypothetical protein